MAYDPTIPAPNNFLSADQPRMQSNFQKANSTMSTDHVPFTTPTGSGDGWHKQITFNQPNFPAIPVNPVSVLYTENDIQGNPQLRFTNLTGPGQYNPNGFTGSIMTFAGIIIKWGAFVIPAGSSSLPLLFAPAFSANACYGVTLSWDLPAQTMVQNSVTHLGFTAVRNSIAGNMAGFYIAIGR